MMTSGSRPAVSARRGGAAAPRPLPLTPAAGGGGGGAGKLGLLDRKGIHSERPGGVGCDGAELPPCLRWKIGRAICRQKLVHVLAGPLRGRQAGPAPPPRP